MLQGSISCKSKLGVGTTFTFDIMARKQRNDHGLSKQEELSHQFEIAKLIQHNYVPLGEEDESDKVQAPTDTITSTDHTNPDQ